MLIKKIIYITVALAFLTAISSIYNIPSKIVYKLIPVFLRIRYGIITEKGVIEGGFNSGIVLKDALVSNNNTVIQCSNVTTDIKFTDIIFPHRNYYNIYLETPKILIKELKPSVSRFRFLLPFWLKTRISISNAELSIRSLGQNFTMLLNGIVDINKRSILMDKWKINLGDLEMRIDGKIDKDRNLDLDAHFTGSKNSFSVTGQIDKPTIKTRWGNIETLFQIEDIGYDKGKLVLPKIKGEIYPNGLPSVDMEGGLIIDKDSIEVKNMKILKIAELNGLVSRKVSNCSQSFKKGPWASLRLVINETDGSQIAEKFPEAVKIFICSHKISADFNIYGKMDDLQAGGILKMSSTPITAVCRYRKNEFSFRTMGEGLIKIYGSANFDKTKNIKIKGSFGKMDIKDFMALLGKQMNDKVKGTVSGKFRIKGEMDSALVELQMEMENTDFGDIEFDVAYLNAQGTIPGYLYLQHSMIYYKEVPAELTGYIDPEGNDIFRNIRIRPSTDKIMIDGINIVKEAGDKVVTFGKDVNENVSVKFKSIVTSDPEQGGEENEPEIELEYKLRENKNLVIKMQEEEGTVGVKQKVRF